MYNMNTYYMPQQQSEDQQQHPPNSSAEHPPRYDNTYQSQFSPSYQYYGYTYQPSPPPQYPTYNQSFQFQQQQKFYQDPNWVATAPPTQQAYWPQNYPALQPQQQQYIPQQQQQPGQQFAHPPWLKIRAPGERHRAPEGRRISDEEYNRRKLEGLCLCCGKWGHWARNCPYDLMKQYRASHGWKYSNGFTQPAPATPPMFGEQGQVEQQQEQEQRQEHEHEHEEEQEQQDGQERQEEQSQQQKEMFKGEEEIMEEQVVMDEQGAMNEQAVKEQEGRKEEELLISEGQNCTSDSEWSRHDSFTPSSLIQADPELQQIQTVDLSDERLTW